MNTSPLNISPIYAITDPDLLPGTQLVTGARAALEGGVRTIQLRNKKACHAEKLKQAKELVKLCNLFQAQLIINDDIEVARLSRAHGVHLGQGDTSIELARKALGEDAIIGITCHADINLARKASGSGANYVAFGRFFNSNTKPTASNAPLSILSDAKRELSIPVVAIGGITSNNMQQIIRYGANSLAVCHSLFATANIQQQAQLMMVAFKNSPISSTT